MHARVGQQLLGEQSLLRGWVACCLHAGMASRLRYEERQRRQEMIDQLRRRIGKLPFVTLHEIEGQLSVDA